MKIGHVDQSVPQRQSKSINTRGIGDLLFLYDITPVLAFRLVLLHPFPTSYPHPSLRKLTAAYTRHKQDTAYRPPHRNFIMKPWYRPGRPTRLAISTCCLAAFLFFGFDQGVFSGILQNENWLDLFHHPVSVVRLAWLLHANTRLRAIPRQVSSSRATAWVLCSVVASTSSLAIF
jgi:hypothetical protein